MRYHFGTGRAPVHRHESPADLDLPGGAVDGRPDAVRLDFDGDGRVDDALWDADGDGAADHAMLDLDDDGRPERAYTDPAGRGLWDGREGRVLRFTDARGRDHTAPVGRDTDGDGTPDAAAVDGDHDPATAELVCDLDGDGRAEQMLVDHDRDGRFEAAYTSSGTEAGARWDVLLADTDGDGSADTEVAEGAAGWAAP